MSETAPFVADLLISNSFDRIRRCGGCGWLFLDASRNHLRRWCSMEICGNRAKAHRHYQRVKNKKNGYRPATIRPVGHKTTPPRSVD